MNFIDISWPISNQITTYKNKSDVKIESTKIYEKDGVRESKICMGLHTGTHIDMPCHFLKDGYSSSQLLFKKVNGECQVLDLTCVENKITAQDLMQFDIKSDIILFKTKNSFLESDDKFNFDFVYLDKSGAEYLAKNFKLNLVGIDYLGIETKQPKHETHIQLFNANVLILEGLRLKEVESGFYNLICLPLKILNVDALPCRAILLK